MEELDYQLLASALLDKEAIHIYRNNIDPETVGKPVGSFGIYQLYDNLIKHYDSQGSVSPASFHSYIAEFPDLYKSLGGKEGYKEFITSLKETEYPEPEVIVTSLDRRSRKTLLTKSLEQLRRQVNNDQADEADIVRLGHLIKEQAEGVQVKQEFKVRTGYTMIETLEEIWEKEDFLPTQFETLNEALGYDPKKGGLTRAGVYGIVAVSGKGKSSLAKSIGYHLLETGFNVLYINFEEPQKLWEKILFTQVTGLNPFKDWESTEAAKATELYKEKLEEWGDRLMVEHDPKSLYYEDIEAWIRQLYIEHPTKPDLVVIDTIQSMFSKTGGKARWGEYEQMMIRLEKLAKDINAAVIITSQQNNNALRESRTELNQSDVGGSVVIVQKATATLVIQERKEDITEFEFDDQPHSGVMEIQIPKNRITGTTYAHKRPLIKYNDDWKRYEPWSFAQDKETNEDKYNIDRNAEEIIGGLI